MELKTIAKIHTDFSEKFGIPRQSGLVKELKGEIVFEPEYRNPDALRDIEGFDYLWIIWIFSQVPEDRQWTPMVRPPKLGGNRRVGVFASRSPYRPNPIGLSCVKLEYVDYEDSRGPVIHVSGIDMLDGTPIVDIKTYQPYSDAHPEAKGGFAASYSDYELKVGCTEELLKKLPEDKREALLGILAQDPRPGYQQDPDREYGIAFAGKNVKFMVRDGVVTINSID